VDNTTDLKTSFYRYKYCLNLKVDKIGKGLSTEDYSTAEKQN
jgi:hypothetical protein